MPEDRDPQTAAPSNDGDTPSTQATAVAEPPAEEKNASGEPQAVETTEPSASADGEAATEADAERRATEETPAVLEDQIQADASSDQPSADEADAKAEAAQATQEVDANAKTDPGADSSAADTAVAAEAPDTAVEAPATDSDADAEAQAAASDNAESAEGEESTSKSEEPKAEAKVEVEAEAKNEAKAEADTSAKAESEAKADTAKDEAKSAQAPKSESKTEGKAGEPKDLDDPALQELREAKEKGTTVHGKVIGWNRGGFHVVIGEVTAFCPASEMELGRPRSPESYMDREMDFKVAKFQRKGRRVVLSRSELLEKHREALLAGLQPGTVTEGVVTSLPDFGAFVDLGGVEGLVHVSELSRSRIKHPRDLLQSGQKVQVKVLKLEKGGDRISLSMKELEPDPWKGVAERYQRGSKQEGKILRHADFGMFVELEPDVEGLVHVSQLAPGVNLKDDALKPGETLEVWIREVDTKRGRISLSMREVPEEDPWKTVAETLPEGEMVDGTVESIAPFGIFINLRPGLTGLLPNSQTGLPRGTNPNRAFNPGSTVSVQVLAVDPKRKRISLGREGSRVEATKADLQEFKQQQKQAEPSAPSAMEAAFAALGFGGGDGEGDEAN